jgi:hypothetical protein
VCRNVDVKSSAVTSGVARFRAQDLKMHEPKVMKLAEHSLRALHEMQHPMCDDPTRTKSILEDTSKVALITTISPCV